MYRIKILIITLLVMCSQNIYADEWDGPDKQLHAVVGAVLGYGGYAAADIYNAEQRELNKVLIGTGVAFAVGLGKEVYDMRQPGNHLCLKDLAVTTAAGFLGGMFGTSIVYIDSTISVSRTWQW